MFIQSVVVRCRCAIYRAGSKCATLLSIQINVRLAGVTYMVAREVAETDLTSVHFAMTSCDKDQEHESPLPFTLPHTAASAYFSTLSMTHHLGLPNASTFCGDIM